MIKNNNISITLKNAPKNLSIKELSFYINRPYGVTRYQAKKHNYRFKKSIDDMGNKFSNLSKNLTINEISEKLDISYPSTMYYIKVFGYKSKDSRKEFSKKIIKKYRLVDWDTQSDSEIASVLNISRQASNYMRKQLKIKGLDRVRN